MKRSLCLMLVGMACVCADAADHRVTGDEAFATAKKRFRVAEWVAGGSIAPLGATDEIRSAMSTLVKGYNWVWERLPDQGGDYDAFVDEYCSALGVLNMMTEQLAGVWKGQIPDAVRDVNARLLRDRPSETTVLDLLTPDPWDSGEGVWNVGRDVTVGELGKRFQNEVASTGDGKWQLELDIAKEAENIIIASWPDREFWVDLKWVSFLVEHRPMNANLKSVVTVDKNRIIWRIHKADSGRESPVTGRFPIILSPFLAS